MRIGVIDVGGNFVGPAIGLQTLGHDVVYYHRGGLRPRLAAAVGHVSEGDAPFDADLVVVAASFTDEGICARDRTHVDDPLDPTDPLLTTGNPDHAALRDEWLADRLAATNASVVVDMSDRAGPTPPGFLALGDRHCKRELELDPTEPGTGAVASFPFLYHSIILELEFARELRSHIADPSRRAGLPALRFAGNVDHPRYAGQRRASLEALADRYPDLDVQTVGPGLPVLQTWRHLQEGIGGIYLAGSGALCFRLHEYAALGIPALAPDGVSPHLPEAWRHVLPRTVEEMRSPVEMVRFYRDHYHTAHAARWLLGIARGACPASAAVLSASE